MIGFSNLSSSTTDMHQMYLMTATSMGWRRLDVGMVISHCQEKATPQLPATKVTKNVVEIKVRKHVRNRTCFWMSPRWISTSHMVLLLPRDWKFSRRKSSSTRKLQESISSICKMFYDLSPQWWPYYLSKSNASSINILKAYKLNFWSPIQFIEVERCCSTSTNRLIERQW